MKKRNWLLWVVLLAGLVACKGTDGENGRPRVEQVAAGVWKLTSGTPEKLNLLSELHVRPKVEAINAMGEAELPLPVDSISVKQVDGKTYIRFPLEQEEKIFGLGLNFQTVEQRGRILRLHMDHYNGRDNGRTHAPVPFFVSSRGYGAFINSARYIDVWAGTSVRKDSQNPPEVRDRNTDPQWSAQPYSDNLEFLVPAEGVEIVLFAGNELLDVVRRFNLYNGGGALPPKWGLGFWHRVPTLYSDRQVLDEVGEFAKRGFPLSVVGLEPGWMSRAYPCTYQWDSTRFPRPDEFVGELRRQGIRTNVWMNGYLSPDCEIFERMQPYTATHTVWCGTVPDYSMPEARELLAGHFQKHLLDRGVSGFKMDENDGYDSWLWPDVAEFPSGNSAEQMRQIYGPLMQDMTMQLFRQRNQRTYGLVRASNAGAASFPYVLYNDYYNHRDFITALINSSFIGVLWTPEVRASQTAEEWLRRMQTVCFSPLAMLDAWADGTKPWSFPEVERQVNDVMRLRMQLIPYLYTAFADYAFYGTPPVRAMNLEKGYAAADRMEQGRLDATANPYALAVRREVKDQFMVGDHLLVAPFFAGDQERQVVLPQGKWYDFYTGELAGEGEVIRVKAELDRIPVYVRDGGIVPLLNDGERADDGRKHTLEVRHYGTKPATYDLYDDDGETFDYEKGEYVRIRLHVAPDAQGRLQGRAEMPEGKTAWSYGDFRFRFMTQP